MERNNFKKPDAGCDKYGSQRLELALYLKNYILSELNREWFIENGTLLGAWRNGKFIPQDDDFDIAMLINSKEEIATVYNKINQKLLNSKYKARLIDSYASKIEIYDESYGKYTLIGKAYNGKDYHYVTLDLQFYLKHKDSNTYEKLYYINPSKSPFHFDSDMLLPLTKIELENQTFNSPYKIEDFLKKNYGSIDPNASYNSETGFYEC